MNKIIKSAESENGLRVGKVQIELQNAEKLLCDIATIVSSRRQ